MLRAKLDFAPLWRVAGLLSATALAAQSAPLALFAELRRTGVPPVQEVVRTPQVGDLDRDGDLDVLAVGESGALVGLRNDGRGVFSRWSGALPAPASGVIAHLLLDVDGDQDLDLLVAEVTGPIALHANDGSGGFGPPLAGALPPIQSGRHFVAGDIDGDGAPDLFVVTAFGQRLLRNSAGVFADVSAGALPQRSEWIAAANFGDVDGDGDADLVLGEDSGQFGGGATWLYRNQGNGIYSDVTATALPPLVGNAAVRRLVDVDGDGDLDLVALNRGACSSGGCAGQPSSLLRNDGTGRFTATLGLPATAVIALDAAFADLDGDQDQDLVVGLAGTNANLQLWRNGGNGSFAVAPGGDLPTTADAAVACVVSDFDGDGRPDLLWAAQPARGNALRLQLGQPGGRFAPAQALQLPPLSARRWAVGDWDRDGDPDAVAALASGGLQLLDNQDSRSVRAVSGGVPAVGGTVLAVVPFDCEGDGDLDLVATVAGQRPRLLENRGGVFVDATVPRLDPWSGVATCVAAGDVDGDGDPDLVFGAPGQPKRLFKNDGAGVFRDATAGSLPTSAASTQALQLVDVDGDGDLDLFLASGDPPLGVPPTQDLQDQLWRNDGTGVFTDVTATSLPAEMSSAEDAVAVDVDADGDRDLVLVGTGAWLYSNDGQGRFTDASANLPPLASLYRTVVAGDVDGDGDPDLLVASGGNCFFRCLPGRRLLLRNQGGGRFVDDSVEVNPAEFTSDWTEAIAMLDIDGDGDPDLLFANTGESRLLRNLQSQLHAPGPLLAGAHWTLEVHARHALPAAFDLAIVQLSTLPRRTPLPPFGTLWLEPMLTLPPVVLSPATRSATIGWPVPAAPGVLGIELHAQAVQLAFPLQTWLGNPVADVIR